MHLRKLFSPALVIGATVATMSAAIAGPLMTGPAGAPISLPKTLVVPIAQTTLIQTKLLNGYRELRSFWLSRALVR